MGQNKSYILKKPMAGVDVSSWQGDIDWPILSHWIDFAIIRAGSGLKADELSVNNQIACRDLGVPYGLYWFSYASTMNAAKKEADYLLSFIHGTPEFPIYFDYEIGSFSGRSLEASLISEIARAFCGVLEDAGFYAGVYTNTSFKNEYFLPETFKRFDLWEANWGNSVSARVHQFSNRGRLPGIKTEVDLNLCYYDYPQLMKDKGFNGFGG